MATSAVVVFAAPAPRTVIASAVKVVVLVVVVVVVVDAVVEGFVLDRHCPRLCHFAAWRKHGWWRTVQSGVEQYSKPHSMVESS
jgi:hypothetical protein